MAKVVQPGLASPKSIAMAWVLWSAILTIGADFLPSARKGYYHLYVCNTVFYLLSTITTIAMQTILNFVLKIPKN
jgi:hypothetical protein